MCYKHQQQLLYVAKGEDMDFLDRIINKYSAMKEKAPSPEEREEDNEEAKDETLDSFNRACDVAEDKEKENK